MKINATLPFDRIEHGTEFTTPEAITEISRLLEDVGFESGCVTDHPCPTGRWLDAGGHHAPDPFVLLSFVAAATTRLRLQTGILVLPYRNPFITARSVATLDLFSNGRVTLGVGAGYLKGEYRSLGIDFESRNDAMDEYLRAMKAAWATEEFAFEGKGYSAKGNRILPLPPQRPHPPLLIGGNARRAIRRAVELGDAWYPFMTKGLSTSTTRTAEITCVEDLAEGIAYMKAHSEAIGRETPPAVVLSGLNSPGDPWNPEQMLEQIGKLEAAGVSAMAVHIDGHSRAEYCDNAERYRSEIFAKMG